MELSIRKTIVMPKVALTEFSKVHTYFSPQSRYLLLCRDKTVIYRSYHGFLLFSLISDRCWVFAFVFTGAALGLLYGVRANITVLQPVMSTLFIDKDTNTYSISKVQAFAWTVVIIGTYVYFAVGHGLIVGRAKIPDLNAGLLSLL
jgi:hypothetical protein